MLSLASSPYPNIGAKAVLFPDYPTTRLLALIVKSKVTYINEYSPGPRVPKTAKKTSKRPKIKTKWIIAKIAVYSCIKERLLHKWVTWLSTFSIQSHFQLCFLTSNFSFISQVQIWTSNSKVWAEPQVLKVEGVSNFWISKPWFFYLYLKLWARIKDSSQSVLT